MASCSEGRWSTNDRRQDTALSCLSGVNWLGNRSRDVSIFTVSPEITGSNPSCARAAPATQNVITVSAPPKIAAQASRVSGTIDSYFVLLFDTGQHNTCICDDQYNLGGYTPIAAIPPAIAAAAGHGSRSTTAAR